MGGLFSPGSPTMEAARQLVPKPAPAAPTRSSETKIVSRDADRKRQLQQAISGGTGRNTILAGSLGEPGGAQKTLLGA